MIQLRSWYTWTAVVCIVAGLAFAGWGPVLVERFDGIGTGTLPGPVATDAAAMTVWSAVAFARVFGAVLLVLGLVLGSLRFAVRPESQGWVALVVLAGLAVVFVLTLAQQIAIWGSVAGRITLAVLALALVTGGLACLRELRPTLAPVQE